ncbi:MAG: tRNA (adenosine(37)-N6)-threonylcarbamoyltransferase complex transferase subunit TsaD [Elusimicrobia bacterium]|nr:tRNA (adenosine(37)-N6)-threonylcarbamoyltransferase complex transferase subunit TsaD [Elusimicrobiota bacterium]
MSKIILGIESSCDETSAAIVENGRKVLSNIVSSQENIHKKYFGVVPELASREHIKNINIVIEKAFSAAGTNFNNISAISYTRGPGLAGSLLVGQVTAQTLAFLYDVPLVDVNHLEGHLYASFIENPELKPPFLSLIVSGGHTELVIVKDFGKYKFLGGTRDDAAGEAFDKVAKLLKLSYPGGPQIDKQSKKGNSEAIAFPRPYLWGSWDFSFSGLKTAVVNFVKNNRKINIADLCASFQQAVIDTLKCKTFKAAEEFKMKRIVVGGGVSANSSLRDQFLSEGKERGFDVYLPSVKYCTDNAAMIACAGYFKFIHYKNKGNDGIHRIDPGMKLKSWN